MKKVVATVLIKDNEIINLSINDNKGIALTLTPPLKRFDSVEELYACVLRLLKNNGFYTHVYKEFGKEWYGIQVIDLNCPSITSTYGVSVSP